MIIIIFAIIFFTPSYSMLKQDNEVNKFLSCVHTNTFDQLAEKFKSNSCKTQNVLFNKACKNKIIQSVVLTCAVPDGVRNLILQHMCGSTLDIIRNSSMITYDFLQQSARSFDIYKRVNHIIRRKHAKYYSTQTLFFTSSQDELKKIESFLCVLERNMVNPYILQRSQLTTIIEMPEKFLFLFKQMKYIVSRPKIQCNFFGSMVALSAACVGMFWYEYFLSFEEQNVCMKMILTEPLCCARLISSNSNMLYVYSLILCGFILTLYENGSVVSWVNKKITFDAFKAKCKKIRTQLT